MNIKKKTIQELAVEHKARPRAERSIRVLLDNVRSGHNVGAIFRTSDALAIEKVYLSGICPKPPHKEIRKSAIGAEQEVSWEYVSQEDVVNTIQDLKQEGYTILALEQCHQSVNLHDFKAPDQSLLIVGNEVDGIRPDLLALCDYALEIPQYGIKHSLNVSVSAGIALWHLRSA